MQGLIHQENQEYIVNYMVIKMHSSCEELADIPGTRLFVGDQAFFSPKLLFRFSYLGKSDFFFFSVRYFSSTIYIDPIRVWNTDLLISGAFLSN